MQQISDKLNGPSLSQVLIHLKNIVESPDWPEIESRVPGLAPPQQKITFLDET
jgi:hypothetical protein